MKLRGRAEAPDGAEGAQFLSARGAKPQAHHGPLQRLLEGIPTAPHTCRSADALAQVSREATSIHQGRWRADVICRGNERKSTSANCSSEPCVHRMEPANSYDLDLLLAV